MAINTVAIQGVIDELRAEVAQRFEAIATLERFIGMVAEKPVAKPRNGGGKRVKAATSAVVKTAKAITAALADEKPKHNLKCDKCGTKYVGARKNAACPACHPRTVTAKEHYGSMP